MTRESFSRPRPRIAITTSWIREFRPGIAIRITMSVAPPSLGTVGPDPSPPRFPPASRRPRGSGPRAFPGQEKQGAQVDVHDLVPVLVGELDRGRPPDDAGVVHEDVAPPELRRRRLDDAFRGGPLAQVNLEMGVPPPEGPATRTQ